MIIIRDVDTRNFALFLTYPMFPPPKGGNTVVFRILPFWEDLLYFARKKIFKNFFEIV